MTETGGYFELDTNGKTFYVTENHPEVGGASSIKVSNIFMLLEMFIFVMF